MRRIVWPLAIFGSLFTSGSILALPDDALTQRRELRLMMRQVDHEPLSILGPVSFALTIQSIVNHPISIEGIGLTCPPRLRSGAVRPVHAQVESDDELPYEMAGGQSIVVMLHIPGVTTRQVLRHPTILRASAGSYTFRSTVAYYDSCASEDTTDATVAFAIPFPALLVLGVLGGLSAVPCLVLIGFARQRLGHAVPSGQRAAWLWRLLMAPVLGGVAVLLLYFAGGMVPESVALDPRTVGGAFTAGFIAQTPAGKVLGWLLGKHGQ